MIDFKFIEALEGNVYEGYVPNPKTSQSGVTIACGFDLGQRSAVELHHLFSKVLADKLSPYVGLKKQQACDALKKLPLMISRSENAEINAQCKDEAELKLVTLWRNAQVNVEFSDLSSACQTVIASVAFQYGNLAKRTPHFWRQVTSGDWQGAVDNLRNFGDAYSSRRNKEADLLMTWLQEQKS